VAKPNRFDQLIDQLSPNVRRAFLDSIQNVADIARVDEIARMLEAGDIDGALAAVGLDPVSFRPLDRALEQTFETGGVATAQEASQGLRAVFQFNIRNPVAELWLRSNSSGLVTDIITDQRNMIRNTLAAGLELGDNPTTTALDLVGRIGANGARQGGFLGLTDSQAAWVRNYAAELASDNPLAALERSLRDRRFDAAVRRAAANGTSIPQDKINKMVTAYRNRALRYRAETIARSETMASLHQAQEMAMRQAVDAGGINRSQVEYIWRSAHDTKVREAHSELDGQVTPMGVPFQSSLGPIRFPGDPQASAANTINCRCWRETKIDFLAGIK